MAEILKLIVDTSNILDPSLDGYECEIDDLEFESTGERDPIYSKGRFCYSFRFIKEDDSKCFRIWQAPSLVNDFGLDQRLRVISQYLKAKRSQLPYFVDFEYIPIALANDGDDEYPGVRMEWINGRTLGDYLQNGHANRPPSRDEIAKLADDFLDMCYAFRRHNISHGDLSAKNIMIDIDGHIRLVDYDSLYVPDFGQNVFQTTGGAPGFQHYKRLSSSTALYAGPKDDNFSQQVIYLSLRAMAYSETIYQKRSDFGDKELLFVGTDLVSVNALENSRAFRLIKEEFATDSIECKLLDELSRSIAGPLSDVKSIVDLVVKQPRNTEQKTGNNDEIERNCNNLKSMLQTYKFPVKQVAAEVYPTKIKYRVIAGPEVKASSIEKLHREIRMVLGLEPEMSVTVASLSDGVGIYVEGTTDRKQEKSEWETLLSFFNEVTGVVPKPMKYCHICGKEFPNDTDKFCTRCGTSRLEK